MTSSAAEEPSSSAGRSQGRALTLPPALTAFLRTESGGASVLLAATLLALVWANSPLAGLYESLWTTDLAVGLGDAELRLDLRHWVNDGLMALFFFVIGLEVRRELSIGELTEPRRIVLSGIAAGAGLLLPAMLYLALNPGGETASGFGIAMATDTAFMLGALALVGPALSTQLRVFLLTVAVFDDIGAMTVVAVFYTESLVLPALVIAVVLLTGIVFLRRLQVWRAPAYVVLGVGLWLATVESGIHPTIAGVVLGLVVPAYVPTREGVHRAARWARAFRQSPTPELARSAKLSVEAAVSSNERLQQLLHPWTSYAVVPVFALANAGIALDGEMLERAFGSTVTWGVLLGLVLGKLLGVGGVSWLATRAGLGALPRGVRSGQLPGAGAIAGIGFTVSLFIVELAFPDDAAVREEATFGVLAAALTSFLLGAMLFRLARRFGHGQANLPTVLDPPVNADRDHVRGRVDAPLTLVEFGDYECAFCGRATGVVAELRERFGDELRYVFRHLPLHDVHPQAQLAAEAAEAAGSQGQYWEMHRHLFQKDALQPHDLRRYAEELALDLDRFISDLETRIHEPRVRADAASAEASGAQATPTFFVGDLRHTGPWDTESLDAALRAARSEGRMS